MKRSVTSAISLKPKENTEEEEKDEQEEIVAKEQEKQQERKKNDSVTHLSVLPRKAFFFTA